MNRPRPRTKRLLLLLLAYAVGGAIINVAVAWVGNWLPSPRNLIERNAVNDWPYSVPSHWPKQCRTLRQSTGIWAIDRYCGRTDHIGSLFYDIDIHRAGWPVDSLRADRWDEYEINPPSPIRYHYDGHPMRTIWFAGIDAPSGWEVLPVRPLWPGFAINTIFYAAILWLLFAAPGFVRRRIRARRGQCPACAYPVGASTVCTECGRPVTRRHDSQ